MIADPINLHQAAVRFGPAIRNGWMNYSDCFDLLCNAALKHPQLRDIPPREFDRLCDRLGRTLSVSVDAPSIAAAAAVREAMLPLLAQRQPRSLVMLAAYRAAGDDLTSHEIESIARETVAAFLATKEKRVAK